MKTINLLPKPRQQELRYEVMFRSLRFVCVLTALSFALVFLVQFGDKAYLQYQAGSIKNQIASLQAEVDKQQNSDVKDKVTAINNLITDYVNLGDNSPKWSNVINAFAPLPPAGVRINSFSIDPSDDSINITGVSPTRDLVIGLYNNILADSADFYNIDYPLDNVIQSKNVDFHFNFYIQKQLLQ